MRGPFLALLKGAARAVGGHGLGRVGPIRWCYDRLFALLRPRRVRVQGHWMFLDEKDTLELATREVYEPLETRLVLDRLKPGATFVDIGANIGYYTLLAARAVGPQGRVIAFEPDPDNFRLLSRNVEANGYHNVELEPKALSDAPGIARLYLNPVNRGDHRLYDSGDGRAFVDVERTTLDARFAGLESGPHFIKMDVQGAEAAVLKGMEGLLARSRGLTLLVEFGPEGLRRSGADPAGFLGRLQALGFKVREVHEPSGELREADLGELARRFPPGDEGYTNLLCEKD